jgi:hypothetical protein
MQTSDVTHRSLAEKLIIGCLWFIGIVVVFGILGQMTKSDAHGDAYSAQLMCEQHFVKDKLLAPASAKFSPDSETNAISYGNEVWIVTGYVDSQNAFGAMLRSPYTCTVKYVGKDTWHLESVKIGR